MSLVLNNRALNYNCDVKSGLKVKFHSNTLNNLLNLAGLHAYMHIFTYTKHLLCEVTARWSGNFISANVLIDVEAKNCNAIFVNLYFEF